MFIKYTIPNSKKNTGRKVKVIDPIYPSFIGKVMYVIGTTESGHTQLSFRPDAAFADLYLGYSQFVFI